jgi:hypothetical protein
MSSVGCPRCEESFRVPDATLPEGLRMRCPWCNETFKLSEIAPRLLPMVDLIGDDDQPIDLSQLLYPAMAYGAVGASAVAASPWGHSGPALDSHGTEKLPIHEPMSRIEPMDLEDDLTEFEEPAQNSGEAPSSSDSSIEQTLLIDSASAETDVEEFTDFDENQFESNEAAELDLDESQPLNDKLELNEVREGNQYDEFDSDQFEPATKTEDDEFDLYQTIVEEDERTPVTGPVAPRPLNAPVGSDFGGAALSAKPRRKKQGSPLMTIVGVVAGGLASVPLAAGVLHLLGASPDFGFWPFDGTLGKKPNVSVSQPMDLGEERPARPPATGRSLADDLNPQAADSSSVLESSASDNAFAVTESLDESTDIDSLPDASDDESTANSSSALDEMLEAAASTNVVDDSSSTTPAVNEIAGEEAPKIPEVETSAVDLLADTTAKPNPIADPTDAPEPAKQPEIAMPADISAAIEASNEQPSLPTLPDLASEASATKPETKKPETKKPEFEMPALPSTTEPSVKDTASSGLQEPAPKPAEVVAPKPPVDAPATKPAPAPANKTTPKPTPPAATPEPAASPELLAALEQADSALKGVLEFGDLTDVKGLKRNKAKLYAALANIASFPSGPAARPAALIDEVAKAGLMNDLTAAAPNWLRYTGRTNNGLLAVGKVVETNGQWVLKWNGPSDLQLKNVDSTKVKSGDEVVIIGKIIDAAPPAIIRVMFIQAKPKT